MATKKHPPLPEGALRFPGGGAFWAATWTKAEHENVYRFLGVDLDATRLFMRDPEDPSLSAETKDQLNAARLFMEDCARSISDCQVKQAEPPKGDAVKGLGAVRKAALNLQEMIRSLDTAAYVHLRDAGLMAGRQGLLDELVELVDQALKNLGPAPSSRTPEEEKKQLIRLVVASYQKHLGREAIEEIPKPFGSIIRLMMRKAGYTPPNGHNTLRRQIKNAVQEVPPI